MAQAWKKGRGKLGPMAPLLGRWKAASEQNGMPVACTREYAKFGDGWVKLEAEWLLSAPKASAKLTDAQRAAMQAYAGRIYRETAFFGPDADGVLAFWSYTNDGKKSSGRLAAAPGEAARIQVAVGEAAPEITGGPWINSEPLSLAGLRGRVVLVEFWTYG